MVVVVVAVVVVAAAATMHGFCHYSGDGGGDDG